MDKPLVVAASEAMAKLAKAGLSTAFDVVVLGGLWLFSAMLLILAWVQSSWRWPQMWPSETFTRRNPWRSETSRPASINLLHKCVAPSLLCVLRKRRVEWKASGSQQSPHTRVMPDVGKAFGRMSPA
jgi:hypothetical protein